MGVSVLGSIPRLLLAAVVATAFASLVTACGMRTDGKVTSQSRTNVDLNGADVLEVISLDPEPPAPQPGGGAVPSIKPGPTFHDIPFLGRSDRVSGADSKALVADLDRMIARKAEVAWACELPRHAVRLHTTAGELDFVIDFECGNAKIYGASGNLISSRSIEGGDPELWYGAFQRAGVGKQSRPYAP